MVVIVLEVRQEGLKHLATPLEKDKMYQMEKMMAEEEVATLVVIHLKVIKVAVEVLDI
jgi:hypothetical protein